MSHIDEGSLHAYLDGACNEAERRRVERHLADCQSCRDRLDEARNTSQRASELLAELEPGPIRPVPWREIEERAAARGRPTVSRATWLRPGLAWAASIVLAFVLGWYVNERYFGSPDLAGPMAQHSAEVAEEPSVDDGVAGDVARFRSTPAEPTRAADALEERDAAAPPATRSTPPATESTSPATTSGTPGEERLADRSAAAPPATGRSASREESAANRGATEVPAERRTMAVAEPERQRARRETRTEMEELARPPSDRPVARGIRQSSEGLAGNAAALQSATSRTLFAVQPEDAAAWLGAPLRTLPELQLRRVQVGPGDAITGGIQGAPVIRLVYEDAAGHQVTLVQQYSRAPGRAADRPAPSLIVEPSGLRTYRWWDEDGYRLMLSGRLSSDSLRALAGRVR